MATDFQGVDLTAKTFPYTQPASFNATRFGAVPWGQAIVNESFDTTTTSAGNDGLISIDISLPSDYVALLRNFHLQMVDTATINWRQASLGFAYQQPGGPYKKSVTAYPEAEYSWYHLVNDRFEIKDRFSSERYYSLWTFGTQAYGAGGDGSALTAFNDAWDPTQLPLWIPPTVDTNFQERSVIMFIENTSASQPSAVAVLRASFDLYTFEQAYAANVMSSPRVFS